MMNYIVGLAYWQMRCIVHRHRDRTLATNFSAARRVASFLTIVHRHPSCKKIVLCLNSICRWKPLISLMPAIRIIFILKSPP